jgi:hypothetical protein
VSEAISETSGDEPWLKPKTAAAIGTRGHPVRENGSRWILGVAHAPHEIGHGGGLLVADDAAHQVHGHDSLR